MTKVATLRSTLEKAKSPTVIKPVPSVNEEMFEYGVPVKSYLNDESPTDVTLFGIDIEDKYLVESKNAASPTVRSPSFKVNEVRSRSLNALLPIEVTFPGIVSEVILVPTNAELPIWVTPVPIEREVTWLRI